MIVDIGSADDGWSGYTLGNDEKRKGARLLKGDTNLGDTICRSTNYANGQYLRMVISYYDDISPKKAEEITSEFLDLFMYGFRKVEYHEDIVEHSDTKFLHHHIRHPKLNLLTGTQLKHYWHKVDLPRKKAIIDYLVEKHGLTHALDRKQLVVSPQKKVEQINSWRSDNLQDPFILLDKKGRGQAEEQITDYINQMNIEGMINSLDDVTAELISMGFKIIKIDRDRGKEFDYITVQNPTGKIRLKGDIYGTEFYRHNQEDRSKAIGDNRSLKSRGEGTRPSLEELHRTVTRENEKRSKWLDERYGTARERAIQKADKRANSIEKELYSDTQKIDDISSPYGSSIGDSDRSISDSPSTQPKPDNRPKCIIDSGGAERKPMVSSDSRGSEYNQSTRTVDDGIRTEIDKRVRQRKEAKRKRDANLERHIERTKQRTYSRVPRVDERTLQAHISRSNKIDRAIGKLNDTTTADFERIKRTTISSTNERAVGQDFDAIVHRIRAGIGGIARKLQQEFNTRTQNLTVGVANVVKKIKLFEHGKKKVMSRLKHKKIKQKPKR